MIGFEYDKEPIVIRESYLNTLGVIITTIMEFPLSLFSSFKPKNKIAWLIRGSLIYLVGVVWYFVLAPFTVFPAIILITIDIIIDEVNSSKEEVLSDD